MKTRIVIVNKSMFDALQEQVEAEIRRMRCGIALVVSGEPVGWAGRAKKLAGWDA